MIETTVNLEEIANPISLAPGTVVGYRANGKPIYNIAGGSLDVDSDDLVDDGDDDDDTDDNDDTDTKDAWTPPTKEEFEKILAAKAKADSEAAARKRLLREAGLDPKTGKPVVKPELKLEFGDDDTEEDDETAPKKADDVTPAKFDAKRAMRDAQRQLEREVHKAEQRERERALTLLVAVPEALEDAGFNPKNLKRALKLLDLDSVTVDSDGEIEGLNEQIDELKADFPEFFKRTRMREAAKEVADTKTVGGGAKSVAPSEENLDFATRLRNQLYRR